jgi:hypothetical protein
MTSVKYPNVKVPLVGHDGNAFAIIGRCITAARRGGVPRTEIDAFVSQAQGGDYNRLLTTVMEWFDTTDSNSDEDDEDDELHDYGDYGSE